MSHPLGGQLLGRRALEMHVIALAGAKRLFHVPRGAGVDGLDVLEAEAFLLEGVFEHRQRLPAVVQYDLLALELVPGEGVVGLPGGQDEPVALVDLGKVHQGRSLAPFEGAEVGGYGRLGDVDAASVDAGEHVPGCLCDGELGFDALGCEKASANGHQERGIKSRMAGDHYVALAHGKFSCPHGLPPAATLTAA